MQQDVGIADQQKAQKQGTSRDDSIKQFSTQHPTLICRVELCTEMFYGRKTLHDSIKFSPSPWSTQPAPLATLHWLNILQEYKH